MNPTVTQGTNFTDTAGRTGVVQYDPNTGAKLGSGETVSSPTAINQAPAPDAGSTKIDTGATSGTLTGGTTDTTGTKTDTGNLYEPSADQTNKLNSTQTELTAAQKAFQDQAKSVQDTITNIQNGTTPLSTAEQAQVDGLKAQFQQLIQQQEMVNKGASGTANIRGYQTGAAEYDPTFQTKTIGAIVSAGQAKVADLNIKMTSAVAELTQALKNNDIAKIKDVWDVYQNASKERTTALQKTIDDTQKAITDARDFAFKKVQEEAKRAQEAIDNQNKATELADKLLTSASQREKIKSDIATDAAQRQKLGYDILKIKKELAGVDDSVLGGSIGNVDLLNGLVNATIGMPENQRKELTSQMNGYLKAGKIKEAQELLVRAAFQGQTGTQREDSIRRMQAIDSLSTIKKDLDAYVAKTGDTGLLSGSMQKIQQKLGSAGTPGAAALNGRITQALQIYRNAITGAAWGDQETAEYKLLFPALTNTAKLNTEIIDSMVKALNANQRITLGSYIGQGTYDKVFQNEKSNLPPEEKLKEFHDSSPENATKVESLIRDNPNLSAEDIYQIVAE